MAKLTARALKAAKDGEWLTDGGTRGGGTLYARKLAGGALLFYFRYTNPAGKREAIPLGEWTGTGGPLSLEAARDRANELSARYRAGDRDLSAVLDAEVREAQREREAAERADETAQARQKATLGALLDAYVGELRRSGKASAREVAASIRRHVIEPWPKLTKMPADDVTLDDLLPVVARLADADKLREAAKIRSYLQAAYNAGIRARQSAKASPELRALKITTNPARDLATIEGASQARDRSLSVAELRAYWKRIKALPDHEGAALRFHLLTGGQRLDQLARITVADYDHDGETITIRDGKGRRKDARVHVVPMIPAAVEAMQAMAPERLGDFVFTVTAGEYGMAYPTINKRCAAVVEAMREAGELPGGPFTIGDLRRTVETRLAAEGVSQDVRAQLQSHGLGGVQARHYDRHDYLQEKRDALETLFRVVTGKEATVIPMRKKRPG